MTANLKYLMVLFLALGISSCSGGKDVSEIVIGKWRNGLMSLVIDDAGRFEFSDGQTYLPFNMNGKISIEVSGDGGIMSFMPTGRSEVRCPFTVKEREESKLQIACKMLEGEWTKSL